MNRSRTLPQLLALLCVVWFQTLVVAQGAPPEPALADLPVTRVVLFTTGVGYFEHAGSVTGDAEIELRVAHEHMDDLLGSLVLEDFDGGRVQAVRYDARDPLERVLASYAIDLSHDPTLAQLLAQARGEAVRLQASERIEGVLVNVEQVHTAEGGTSTLLTLATEGGLRRVPLDEVRDVWFERAELRAELDAALAAIARSRDGDANVVRLRFEGDGERRVRIGYLREMPVWKPSYRIVLGDDGRADLQGWAILDNPTNLDLIDVQVAFVAGLPISIVSELFAPVYVDRPRVGPSLPNAVVPPIDGGAFARSLPMAPSPLAMDMAAEAAPPPRLGAGSGVAAMAEGVATGTSFAYVVQGSVSVGRYESAMIPVLVASVAAPRASLFVPGVAGSSPLRAVRLVNDTPFHLAAGPVTLFDAGGFVGNARLGDVPPGEERLLSYAIDQELQVAVETAAAPEELTGVSLRGGLLETVHRLRVRTVVRVAHPSTSRFLVIELPRRPGYDVVSPEPAPTETAAALRFGVALVGDDAIVPSDDTVPTHATCEGDAPCRLEVVFERVESRTIALANVDSERLVVFLENVTLDDDDRAVLAEIVALGRRASGLARDAAAVAARIDALFRDQERVRQNMAALDRNSTLYRRYLADLESQEDELAELAAERDSLVQARRAAQEALDDLLAGLAEAATE
ncbi:MAG: hypothetical protein H0U69_03975 [Trueperaceae bacterium]|nr:hypothetical protein [Trueperaceae bacterium]